MSLKYDFIFSKIKYDVRESLVMHSMQHESLGTSVTSYWFISVRYQSYVSCRGNGEINMLLCLMIPSMLSLHMHTHKNRYAVPNNSNTLFYVFVDVLCISGVNEFRNVLCSKCVLKASL